MDTNRVKLELTVESPADRPLLQILVNQTSVGFDPPKLAGMNGDYSVWKVSVPEVFVNDGEKTLNNLEVEAVSDDGAATVSGQYWHHRRPQAPATQVSDMHFQDQLSAKLAELTGVSLC